MSISIWNVLSFNETISNVYYITVIAVEQSYFMINTHIIRH
jgi:hypothetical protein